MTSDSGLLVGHPVYRLYTMQLSCSQLLRTGFVFLRVSSQHILYTGF